MMSLEKYFKKVKKTFKNKNTPLNSFYQQKKNTNLNIIHAYNLHDFSSTVTINSNFFS